MTTIAPPQSSTSYLIPGAYSPRLAAPRSAVARGLVALAAFLLLLAYAPAAEAGAFQAKRIPARAEGVIHLDLEKLQASKIWPMVAAELPAELRKKGGDAAKVSEDLIRSWKSLDESGIEALAMSMLGQARSLTVWSGAKEEFAVIVELPLAGVALSAAVKAGVPLTKSSQGGVELYQFDSAFVHASGSTIVVSTAAAPVVTTAKLLRGKGRSLSKDKLGALGASATKGIILVAGFGGELMEAFKKEAASAALKTDIRSMILIAGEHKSKFFMEATATLGSPETATKLQAVVGGLRAVVALSSDEPELKQLLNGLNVTTDGAKLKARLELPLKVLRDLSKAL